MELSFETLMNKGFQQINNFERVACLLFSFLFLLILKDNSRKTGLSLSTRNRKMLIKFFTKFF
jgi:hypothetical protein